MDNIFEGLKFANSNVDSYKNKTDTLKNIIKDNEKEKLNLESIFKRLTNNNINIEFNNNLSNNLNLIMDEVISYKNMLSNKDKMINEVFVKKQQTKNEYDELKSQYEVKLNEFDKIYLQNREYKLLQIDWDKQIINKQKLFNSLQSEYNELKSN